MKEALRIAQREKKLTKTILWTAAEQSVVRCVVEIVLVILQVFMQLCYIAAILQVFYVVMFFSVLCNCLKSPLCISLLNYLMNGRTVRLETSC